MNFLEVTKPQLSEINDSLQSEQTSENQNKLNPSNTGEHS